MKENKERPEKARGFVQCAKNQEIMENTAPADLSAANVVVTLCGEQPVVSSRRVAADFGGKAALRKARAARGRRPHGHGGAGGKGHHQKPEA